MPQAKKRNALGAHQFIDAARRGKTEPLAQLLLIEKAIFFFHLPGNIARSKNGLLNRRQGIGQLLGNKKTAPTQKRPKNILADLFWSDFGPRKKLKETV
jgi:hypothetical protein